MIDDGFEVGEPTVLFQALAEFYDIHPDGQRLVVAQGDYESEDRIVVTVNALAR